MSWIDLHKRRHTSEGGSISKAHEHQTGLFIDSSIKDSPTYKLVTINGVEYDTRMITERKFSVASGYYVMKLLYKPFVEPRNGQLVYIDDDVWLTVHADSKSLAPFNYIRKCTHTIDFLDDKGAVIPVPSVLETRIRDTQKLLELRYVDLSLDSLKITVPYNDVTRLVEEKDRYLIEGIAWEVQGYDRITQVSDGDGIIEIAVKKVPLNKEEEESLKPEIEIDPTIITLVIAGADEVYQREQAQMEGIVMYDGVVVEGGEVVWASEDGQIDSDGLFTANCSTGTHTITASYEYIDGCDVRKVIEASKEILVYNNKDWW